MDTDLPPPPRGPGRKAPLSAIAGILLAAVAIAGTLLAVALTVVLLQGGGPRPPEIEVRGDPVTDLLAWLPATAETRRAFAVWTQDGIASPPAGAGSPDQARQLAIEPRPRVLGGSRAWPGQFGWSIAEVTAWAAAGRNGEIAVLEGSFDRDAIEDQLEAAGYQRSLHRGVVIRARTEEATPGPVIDGDAVHAASAIAFVGDRIIASADLAMVRRAIDTAIDGAGSLATEPAIAGTLPRLAPLTGLAAVDQADHALACDPALAGTAAPAGQYVLVAYGRLGEGGQRRTAVVTTYPDEATAAADLALAGAGWLTGGANAGPAGGGVEAFGRVADVRQVGNTIVVTLLDGRDDGWVRAGIRFAAPACRTALAVTAPATPVPVVTAAMRLARASLGDPGVEGHMVAVDVAAAAAARGLAPPGTALQPDDIAAWWTALGPVPAIAAFPGGDRSVADWAGTYRIAPAELKLVAERRANAGAAPVGVMIGGWDPGALHNVLRALGYDSIQIGAVTHYAHRGLASESPWRNVALLGDRLWYSADQRAMREAIEVALGERAPNGAVIPLADALWPLAEAASAFEMAGVGYDLRGCASVRGPVRGTLVAWTAGSELGLVAVLPEPGAALDEAMTRLEALAPALATWTASAGATPVADPAAQSPRTPVRFLGVSARTLPAGAAAVATFAPDAGVAPPGWFFANAAAGCRLSR